MNDMIENGLKFYTQCSLEKLKAGETVTDALLTKRVYSASQMSEKVRLIGRTKFISDGILCDHPASGIEFQGFMSGELYLLISCDGDNYFTVYIDGKRCPERLYPRSTSVKLASFEGNCFHTVKILKQSESVWTRSTINGIELTGELISPPKPRDILIEVLGDSLTTGFGNLGVKGEGSAQGGNTPHKEDATQTYGFLASEMLNADCTIVAWSGIGINKGCVSAVFGEYYKRYSYHRNRDGDYYAFDHAPDLIVIHLGANDSTNKETKREDFVQKAKEFITYLRAGYKKEMPIIWAYDPDEGVPEYIQEVLDYFGGEEKGFYILELEWHSKDEMWGASGHPGLKAHKKHAEILVDFIKKNNILK
ncbi:MAG: hypothetical protein E7678_05310 [Ruminococcaceae bacterium]|nr:hypothetical protein [Oscillospiraceae bacterium]